MKHLPETLRALRQYHRLKQKDLALKLGLSANFVSEMETGTKSPTVDVLKKYEEAFDFPVSSILFVAEHFGESTTGLSLKMHPKLLKIHNWYLETSPPNDQ